MADKLVTEQTLSTILQELGALNIMAVQVEWPKQGIPDNDLYQPFARGWATFAPWRKDPRIVAALEHIHGSGAITLVDTDRLWTLVNASLQTQCLPGEVWEMGVYKGGSAYLFKLLLLEAAAASRTTPATLRLFDSFEGLPAPDARFDVHPEGKFSDTSLEAVRKLVGAEPWIDFRQGWLPKTFAGLEDKRIRLAHVDVDLYQPILDCCDFVYPRLVPGGMMVFDDYGVADCPGARAAVDYFFRGKPERPFALINGQCLVVKHCG